MTNLQNKNSIAKVVDDHFPQTVLSMIRRIAVAYVSKTKCVVCEREVENEEKVDMCDICEECKVKDPVLAEQKWQKFLKGRWELFDRQFY